jgi:methylated-DNA-[protein]-cysteine S-methyltransferase
MFLATDPDAPVIYDVAPSPLGNLLLTGDGRSLTGLYMLDAGGKPPSPRWTREPTAFTSTTAELAGYFGGERTEFTVPLAPSGSAFQLAVWAELARIPFGVTVSYGEVALALGKSLVASRAVGLANGRNPISIIIPCHRVIGADGSLTGYGWGLPRKEWLLRHEGALTPASATLW